MKPRWSSIFPLAACVLLSSSFPAQAQPVEEQKALASAAELSAAFRSAARDTLPAVVSVEARTKAQPAAQAQANPLEDELFRRFFNDFGGIEQFRERGVPPQRGQGSGFVIDPSGIILTNSHVVNGADSVSVVFHDGTELVAESWHTDPWSDVAVVRVKSETPLPSIPFGDSARLEIGDWVLALGDPFGVGTSVTAGIISGKGRAPHINAREDFLQTDAAINPGNSGGPLVNLAGEVIGINTAISTRSGGYDGVGFAVPSNLARWVAQQLIETGKVARPYLGVAVQPLTAELRREFGTSPGQGALVAQTFPDSPAEKADVRPGDVIVEVNGTPVNSGVTLQGIVERLDITGTYPVTVLRDGKRMSIPVQLQEMPDQFASTPASGSREPRRQGEPETTSSDALGIDVAEITPEIRQSLGLEGDVKGVVVVRVDSAGPAAEKGVSRGDVIERVGTTPVSTVDEFNAAVARMAESSGVLLHLRQGNGKRFVVVTPR